MALAVHSPWSSSSAAAAVEPDRVMRHHQQLREASIALGLEDYPSRHSLSGSQLAESSPLPDLKSEMRRLKYAFKDAHMLDELIKGCADNAAPWKEVGDGGLVDSSRNNLWENTKQRNKELKNARKREEEVHKQLHRNIAEAYDEAYNAHSAGRHELDLMRMSQEDLSSQQIGEGEDLDLCPRWDNGPHSEAAEAARRGTSELAEVMSLRQHEARKRDNLEAELQELENEFAQVKARSKTWRQESKEAFECANSLETVHQAQMELGFPKLTFLEETRFGDGSRCDVVLMGGAASTDEALHTVGLEFGKDGELTRATPHAALGLQREAGEAVKRDDLPWLLTMVWHRICEPSERKTRKPSRGGA